MRFQSFFILAIFLHPSHAAFKLELLKMENCSSSQRTFYIETCEYLPEGINFTSLILRPLPKIFVQLNMARKENSVYKSVFKVPPTEWCSVMSRKAKPNFLVKAFLETIRERMPKVVQKCPMDGRIEAYNLSFKSKMIQIFPKGVYRVSARGYDDVDENILTMSFLMRIEN
jgi:hypothetical protein